MKRSGPAALAALVVALSGAACGSSNSSKPRGSRAGGEVIARGLETGWGNQSTLVKGTDETLDTQVIAGELKSAIRGKAVLTQVGAIESVYVYLLQSQGRLAVGTPGTFLSSMEAAHPATSSTLRADARRMAAEASAPEFPTTGDLQASLSLPMVASCLRLAGAVVEPQTSLSQGAAAVYAVMPLGTSVGVIVVPRSSLLASVEAGIATQSDYTVDKIANDTAAFVLVKGKSKTFDMAIVSRCTA